MWAARPELEPHDVTDTGDRLVYSFDSKRAIIDRIEKIAAEFPHAHLLLTFRNDNAAIHGFAEYLKGVEPADFIPNEREVK
jgi:hypothetical protein